MSQEQNIKGLRPSWVLLFFLFCYFGLHVLLRITLSETLDFDEAEQAVLSQWLMPGYTEQPPLYTWIQRLCFEVFGKGALAVSLMKNGLLFLTYVFVHLSGLLILKNHRAAILATISLLLIPQIGWESQRDMTHTVLVVCAASATLYQILRTVRRKTLLNYLLLGICLSVGFLGKVNYALFLCVTLLALLTSEEGRRFFFCRFFPLALVIPALSCGEYLWWMYNNQDIVFSATYKFKQAFTNYWFAGPLSLARAILFFLFPCWLFWLLIFPAGYTPSSTSRSDFEHTFIARYMLFFLLTLLTVVLCFKVTYVKDRWLQPLLFATPLYFFSRLTPEQITTRKFRIYAGAGVLAAAIIYSTFTLRIVAATWINNFSRMNYPFREMAMELRGKGFENGLILTNKRFLAGNMLLQFPDSTAIIPDYHFERQPLKKQYDTALILWMPAESKTIPEKFSRFLRENYAINTAELKTIKIEKPHRYTKKKEQTVILGAAITSLPPRKAKIENKP